MHEKVGNSKHLIAIISQSHSIFNSMSWIVEAVNDTVSLNGKKISHDNSLFSYQFLALSNANERDTERERKRRKSFICMRMYALCGHEWQNLFSLFSTFRAFGSRKNRLEMLCDDDERVVRLVDRA